MELKLALI